MNTTINTAEISPTAFQVTRKHLRFPFSGKADLTAMRSGQHMTGQVSEIGPCGCYVDTPEAFKVGTKVGMFIRSAERSCALSGKVLYVHKGWGMGVVFDDGQPEAFATVDGWLLKLDREKRHTPVH